MGLLRLAAAAALGTTLAAGGVAAALAAGDYPNKVIKIIVPAAPGGTTDIVGRAVAERLAARLGSPVIVENKAGGGGSVGAEAVLREPADGYTLLLGNVATHAINPAIYKNLSYSHTKDFAPVSMCAMGPNMLVVHPSVPARTVAELVAVLKANPDKYQYGSTGVGTSTHLLAELFMTLTGTKMTHVPYRGSGPLIPDLIAGHVQIAFDNLPTAAAQVKAGTLVGLGVTSAQRWPELPDVPAVGETVAGFSGTSWQGLFARAGVPDAILETLSAEVQAIMKEPEMVARFAKLGTVSTGMTRAQMTAFVDEDSRRWADVAKASGAGQQ